MFFLFPVGNKDTTVKRQPWISYTIIALNVLIFLFFTQDGLRQAETKRLLVEIFNYSIEHPNVELSLKFRESLPKHLISECDRVRVIFQEIVQKPGEVTLRQEQAHIDQLTDTFLSAYQKDSYHQWGYIPSRQGHIHTLVSNMFFHAGFIHLLVNMFLFYLCGPLIEDRWGKLRLATFYIVCGIVSSLLYGWLSDTPNVPLIGASGSIAGVIGVFLIKFFHTKIRFLYVHLFWFRLFKGTFQVPAYAIIPLWLLQQYDNAVFGVYSNVAFWAQVGGFIFGVVITLGLKFSAMGERSISPLIDGKVTSAKSRPLFEKALQEWGEGRSKSIQSGPNAVFMREAEVPGRARTNERSVPKTAQLNVKPALLIGLSAAQGLKLKDEDGSQLALPWPEIILYSIALVKRPSQAATDNRYSVYFDFFYDTHEDEGAVFYNGFRLYSYQLPVRRLFREDVPAAEAYRKFAMYLQKHMVAPGIPNSDELKRFNLSRYYSASAYEESLTHQLSTFAVNEETLSAVEL